MMVDVREKEERKETRFKKKDRWSVLHGTCKKRRY